ncbi:TraK domain-containing protein [Neisseria sp. Ec49-e6-T10]|uniref:TraK domain-containing protein n=1 Tax=Neisseria sp. Ec49-e6-T10 TaxID=3140744 RepID=UPI003EB95B5B
MIISTKKLNQLFISALFSGCFLAAYAAQYLQADESQQLNAIVSTKAMTRISIEGGRIINARFLDGELDLQKDEITGQVYIKPIGNKKKINLFVTSDSNRTYLVVLNTSGVQADSIIIQEKTAQINQLKSIEQQQARMPQPISSKQDAYARSIKAFLIAIANNNTTGFGAQITPSYAEVPLWKEVLFIRKNRYSGADLFAESFTLTNITKEPIVLAEQEFYKPRVLAVAIRKLQLAPGEQTEVFIVQSGGN